MKQQMCLYNLYRISTAVYSSASKQKLKRHSGEAFHVSLKSKQILNLQAFSFTTIEEGCVGKAEHELFASSWPSL